VTDGTAKVEFVDEEPNGIAAMIGGLIEANLQSHPERSKLLKPAVVGIVAEDAHVSLTLRITPGHVQVANGLPPSADVVVRSDSETLTELSSAPLRMGFPDAFTSAGRAVTGKLFSGTLTVRGLIRHAGAVSRLNRLLSVV
jgi:hypothetical protein